MPRKKAVYEAMRQSLRQIQLDQVETYFLHSPDPTTPIEETLSAIQELYLAGKFKRFGLSNFDAEKLENVYNVCRERGYVLPTVFHGNYSAVARHAESDLFPLLRKLNIAFYVYSPLAGGFLAKSPEQFEAPNKGRWDPSSEIGKLYNRLYNRPQLVAALKQWGEAADKAGCTRAALAYRRVRYHSSIKAQHGDAILIGASSKEQLLQTLDCLEDGPLSQEVLPWMTQCGRR